MALAGFLRDRAAAFSLSADLNDSPQIALVVYTAADGPAQEKLDFLTGWPGQTPPPESRETPPTRHETET